MEEENKTIQQQKPDKKAAVKLYITAFSTGFLTAVLIALLVMCGPALYYRAVKHTMSPETKARAIYHLMKKYYIEDVDIDEVYEGVYAGMTAVPTDKYSYYMSAEDAKEYDEKTNGNYVGIGIQIMAAAKTKELEVTAVFKPSPAHDCGINKGDILRSVSGVTVTSDNMDEAVDLVRGPENTSVDFVIYRPSEQKEYEMTCYRKAVDMNTVYGLMLSI